jgi:predicted O-linked N-acetylglucosamine transferase (SPINDLY family)
LNSPLPPLTIEQAFALAVQHQQAGHLAVADDICRQILAKNPADPNVLHLRGVIASQTGRFDAALDWLSQSIALAPNCAEAHYHLGNLLLETKQHDGAIAAYRQAIALKPDLAAAHTNLGIILKSLGQFDQAIASYQAAIALRPDLAEAHNNLGSALQAVGRFDQAVAAHTQAIRLKPQLAEAHNNLGSALHAKGHLKLAAASTRAAIAINPNFSQAYANLGFILKDDCQLDDALAAFERAVALAPDSPAAHGGLGVALKDIGRLDEAIASFQRAVDLDPHDPAAHGNLIFAMLFHPASHPAAIFEAHRRWNQQHAAPLAKHIVKQTVKQIVKQKKTDPPNRRLRIGYVSPDFREHVVPRFILPLLTNHDRARFELFAYVQVPIPDDTTRQLQSHVDHWRNFVGLSDLQAADLIRNDRIDILVDLAGHSAGNRLLLFAHKPAPVQITYLGYPATTGLSTIDYRLTDAHADPPGQTEQYHSEHLIRLPASAWCYSPTHSPPVSPRQPGPITFGCFNAFPKINGPLLRLWGRILQSVPESRLLLKSLGLSSTQVQNGVRQLFTEMAVDPARLDLRGFQDRYHDHLALYAQMDIALDTFPYHGTTTTCEALYMGLPVVSLAGPTHVSRVGVSLLTSVGLPHLLASSPDEYVSIAVALANDLPRLAELRATLRRRMETSPLMDAPAFARAIESAYSQAWQTWCDSK